MEEDQGTPYALRAERNWRKTKYADAGRQNLALNAWNEQRPWLSYISPHVFTPKEDQEGWTNGRFPHTKLKLCHKGVLFTEFEGSTYPTFNRFPDFDRVSHNRTKFIIIPFFPVPVNKISWSLFGLTLSASITLHETVDWGSTQLWRALSWNDQ